MTHFLESALTRGYERSVGKPSQYLNFLLRYHQLRVKDLITRTGISRASVARHLSGEIEPNVEQREKYALQGFRMTLDEFERGWKEYEPTLREAAKPSRKGA
jgi:transcriptional regulator with XRE-family HTH domain